MRASPDPLRPNMKWEAEAMNEQPEIQEPARADVEARMRALLRCIICSGFAVSAHPSAVYDRGQEAARSALGELARSADLTKLEVLYDAARDELIAEQRNQ